jgi:hypothetical protein
MGVLPVEIARHALQRPSEGGAVQNVDLLVAEPDRAVVPQTVEILPAGARRHCILPCPAWPVRSFPIGRRPCQRGAHEGKPDTAVLPLGMDGNGPQQQRFGTRFSDAQWPVADGAHNTQLRLADDHGKAGRGCVALAQTVAGFGAAGEAEGQI